MAEQITTEDKVQRYETFLNERLRGDLRKCLEQRDKIYQEQAEFLALRNSIQAIKTAELVPGEPLKTKVDLGCNFYCQVPYLITQLSLQNISIILLRQGCQTPPKCVLLWVLASLWSLHWMRRWLLFLRKMLPWANKWAKSLNVVKSSWLGYLSKHAQAEQLSKECAKLKAHIKLVIGGLQELQQIGLEEPRKPQRDIFSWFVFGR